MKNLKDVVKFLRSHYSIILSKPSVRSVRDFLSGVVAKSDDHQIRLEIIKFSAWMSVRSPYRGCVVPWYVFFENPDTEESFQSFMTQIASFLSNETFVVISYPPLQIQEDIGITDLHIEIEKHGSEDIFYVRTRTRSGEYSYLNFSSNSLEEAKKFCSEYLRRFPS